MNFLELKFLLSFSPHPDYRLPRFRKYEVRNSKFEMTREGRWIGGDVSEYRIACFFFPVELMIANYAQGGDG